MRAKCVLLTLLLAAMMSLGGCGEKTVQETLSKKLNLNLTVGEIVAQSDSHEGFHGDGFALVVLRFSDDRVGKELGWNEDWLELPMPEALDELMDRIPEAYRPEQDVHSGYYFFEDRYSQTYDRSDPKAALRRGNVNFTAAVYDSETRTLYYCEADS